MKKIIFAFLLLGAVVATKDTFAQCCPEKRTDKFKKVENGGQVQEQTFQDAPDQIQIGGKYNYSSYEQIYAAFKNHPDHKNDANFTVANLKKWNDSKAVSQGTYIMLIEPKKRSGLR